MPASSSSFLLKLMLTGGAPVLLSERHVGYVIGNGGLEWGRGGKLAVGVGVGVVVVVVRSCSNAGTAAVPSTLLRTNVHWARMWRGLARVSLNQSDKIPRFVEVLEMRDARLQVERR